MGTVPRFRTAEPTDEMLAAYRRDGFLVIDELIPPTLAAEMLEWLRQRNPDYFVNVEGHHIVGDGRFNAPIEVRGPFADERLLGDPRLTALFNALLGEQWVIEAFGVVMSLPGATMQNVHQDGMLLFEPDQLARMLPAYAITFSIPLAAADDLNGATEFWPGSHRTGYTAEAEGDGVRPEVLPGSGALWDFRVVHRGRPNNGATPRPLLYLTVCRPWWTDSQNFWRGSEPRLLVERAIYKALPKPLRKRFVRAELVD